MGSNASLLEELNRQVTPTVGPTWVQKSTVGCETVGLNECTPEYLHTLWPLWPQIFLHNGTLVVMCKNFIVEGTLVISLKQGRESHPTGMYPVDPMSFLKLKTLAIKKTGFKHTVVTTADGICYCGQVTNSDGQSVVSNARFADSIEGVRSEWFNPDGTILPYNNVGLLLEHLESLPDP